MPPYFCLRLWPLGSLNVAELFSLGGDRDDRVPPNRFSSFVLSRVSIKILWRKSGSKLFGRERMPEKSVLLNALIIEEHSVPWCVRAVGAETKQELVRSFVFSQITRTFNVSIEEGQLTFSNRLRLHASLAQVAD